MRISIDSRRIANIIDMMKIIENLLATTWGQDKVTFSSAYPQLSDGSSLNTPIITYQYKKAPGEYNSTKEIKPRFREAIKVEDTNSPLNEHSVEIWGQMFDYLVEFKIWAESGEEADRVTRRFQEFMFKYTGYLKKMGVNEIIFEESFPDNSDKRWRTDLMCRSIVYYMRIDEIVGAKVPLLENVIVDELFVHPGTISMLVDILAREEDQ